MLMDYQGNATVKIDGMAASAASVIAMAGTEVQMSPLAMMMIHNKNKFRTLEYDDKLVRKIIQSVTVYEDHFVIAFKTGIEIEI